MTLVTDAAASVQIKEEPLSNESTDQNQDHFILDQTEQTPIHFSFDQDPIVEAPVVEEETIEEEVTAEVELENYDAIWDLNAVVSIEAADRIEEELEAELEEEVAEEVEEAPVVMAFEQIEYMPSLVIEDEMEELVADEIEEDEMDEVEMEELVEEEEEEEVFALNMTPETLLAQDFILNKPTNIYAEEEEETIEAEIELEPVMELIEEEEVLEEEIEEEVYIEEEYVLEEEIMEEEMMEEEVMAELVAPVEMYTAPIEEPAALAEVAFETSFRYEEEPTMQLVMREESNTPVAQVSQHANYDMPLDNAEEQRKKVAERIQKLRNLSFNINNGNDPNNDFESVPAYVRRNMDMFGNTMASVENYYSKYTVDKDENNQTQISTINTFMDGKKPD
jgi:cell division protein FtsZ